MSDEKNGTGDQNQIFNKNIRIAVDESSNARRAVVYVARLLGGLPGFRIYLLHVLSPPEEDFFPSTAAKDAYVQKHRQEIERILEAYRQILTDNGFAAEAVSTHAPERCCPSIADCILAERELLQPSTIVIGRRGVSRQEEFLFGSVSNKIVHKAKGCTVWVVE
jgi:nucleotide-binding universal stress UspA family protein